MAPTTIPEENPAKDQLYSEKREKREERCRTSARKTSAEKGGEEAP